MSSATISYAKPIAERFSLYFVVTDNGYDSGSRLVSHCDPTLKELMECLVKESPQKTEDEWAKLLLKDALEAVNAYQFLLLRQSTSISFTKSEEAPPSHKSASPGVSPGVYVGRGWFSLTLFILLIKLCQRLLFSYLQLICFYSAKKVSEQLKRTSNLGLHYSLEDCFAIATETSLKPTKLLKRFDFNSRFPVHAYARKALDRSIKDRVVQEVKSKSFKLSDYALLISLRPKQLIAALQEYGTIPALIPQYRLVWQGLKEIKAQAIGKFTFKRSLNADQLNAICAYYRQQIQRLQLNLKPLNSQEVQQILNICIVAVRNQQQRKFISLDDEFQGVQNIVVFKEDILLTQEKNRELAQLTSIIQQHFQQLEITTKNCLLLWLGLGINQTDFTKLLKVKKQYQVTRQFQRYQRKVLTAIIRSYHHNYHQISQGDRLEELDYLKEYLARYSKDFFEQMLTLIVQKLSIDQQQILIEGFNQKTSNKSIFTLKQQLENQLKTAIEQKLQVNLADLPSSEARLSKFIDFWLDRNLAVLSASVQQS